VHAAFEHGDEIAALRAPITEYVVLAPTPGVARADLARAVDAATKMLNHYAAHLNGAHKCFGAAWGYMSRTTRFATTRGGRSWRCASVQFKTWTQLLSVNKAREKITNALDVHKGAAVKMAKIWHPVTRKYTTKWEEVTVQSVVQIKLTAVEARKPLPFAEEEATK
jgi:hypothetical protein